MGKICPISHKCRSYYNSFPFISLLKVYKKLMEIAKILFSKIYPERYIYFRRGRSKYINIF